MMRMHTRELSEVAQALGETTSAYACESGVFVLGLQ